MFRNDLGMVQILSYLTLRISVYSRSNTFPISHKKSNLQLKCTLFTPYTVGKDIESSGPNCI